MISFQTLALLINIAIVFAVAVGAFRRRGTAGAEALIALCALITVWTAAYLIYDNAGFASFRQAAQAAIYLGAFLSASAALWIVLVRTNRRRWISLRSVSLFALIPVLSLVLFGAGPLFGTTTGSSTDALLGELFIAPPWGRAVALYVFVVVLAATLLLLDALLHGRLFSSLGAAFVGAALPPAVLMIEYAGKSPFRNLDILPFAFGLSAVGFLNGLFYKRPEEIGAIDRHAAVEGMDEGWIILDVNDTVVDMNPAAERMSGLSHEQVYGQPISALLGDLSSLGLSFNTSQEVEMKRSIQLEEGWRYLNIRISTLMDPQRTPFGRLTLWRDMTDRKMTEDSRQRARDEMFVLLNAISSAASNTLSTEDFLLESIYHIIYPFRSQVVGIFLLEETNQSSEEPHFLLSSHLGLPAPAIEDLGKIPAGAPLFNSVMTRREFIQVEDAARDDRVPGALRRIPVASLLVLPLIAQVEDDNKLLGCMCLARKEKPSFSQDEIVRLQTLSDHMANLIDSDRRRKLAIAIRERERLMRDLHDSVSQKLYGLVTTTEAAQAALEAGSNVDPRQEFVHIGEYARQAVKEMRLFLYQMQQIDVEKDGLISVLHHRLSAVEGRADIKARLLTAEEEIALATEKEITLYYIAQEALNNVLRHAHAKSVLVTLKQGRKNVILEILDDGVGFDLKKVDRAGLGLQNMRERAAQMNGKLRIITKPDQGTKVMVTVPKDLDVKPGKRRRPA